MRFSYLHILTAATLILLPAGVTRAEDSASESETLATATDTAEATTDTPLVTSTGMATTTTWAPQDTATGAAAQPLPAYQSWDPIREFAVRVGAWGVQQSGSPTRVGEWQDLGSSPFWNADGLISNGDRTIDFTLTGTDNETSAGRLHFYGGPRVTADLEYDRFRHRLDYNSFDGWNGPVAAPLQPYVRQLNDLGADHAYRVQEFKANFKGNLTDNLKWRVNVFGLRKEGDRQATAMAHCYQGAGSPTSQCHAVSNSQHIDWQTTEVEPAIEMRLGENCAIEYSHTARTFVNEDSVVTQNFNRAGGYGFTSAGNPLGTAGYAIVPNSTTQIDRLKVHAELPRDNDLYLMGYAGDSINKLRDTHRHFGGVDGRITNSAVDHLELTMYGKVYTEHTDIPTVPLNTMYPGGANAILFQEATVANVGIPINRDSSAAGLRSRWKPFEDEGGTLRSGLAFTGGYEYATLRRDPSALTLTGFQVNGTVFDQPSTNRNIAWIGVEEKWSLCFTSYIRYKYISTQYPLYGVTPGANAPTVDGSLNSSLPDTENRVELGATWSPSDRFLLNGTVFAENASNHSPGVRFDSNTFPVIVSGWFGATEKLSFNGGYANFSNWINQDVTLVGLGTHTQASANPNFPWTYAGNIDVFNVGLAYNWCEKIDWTGGFEYTHGLNAITSVPTPVVSGAGNTVTSYADPNANMANFSRVEMHTYRVSFGFDYLWRPRITPYFRYNYYDYVDASGGAVSGQAHMVLGGVTATY